MHRSFRILALLLFCFSDVLFAAELRVVKGAPTGEISTLSQANEIRVTFSEPMVTLGAIPPRVEAPFFRIEPRLQGTFRWAGTTTLVFTPTSPLPYATKFTVTIGTSAVSAAGNRLAAAYDFTFTTPSVRLLSTSSYRKGERFDMPLVLALRFNQPVDAPSILAALTLERIAATQWSAPVLPPDSLARLAKVDPAARADFDRKLARAAETARGEGVVEARLAADWNKKRFPPSRDLVVVETTTPVEPGSTIEVIVGETVASPDGRATPGRPQQFRLQSEQAFFTDGFVCTKACDPEGYNPLRFRASVSYNDVSKVIRIFDVTDPNSERELAATKQSEWSESMRSSYIDLDELGYRLEPARNYLVLVDRSLRSQDGQTLGYTWAGTIENWHRPAFTSFGDGHGVWEASGGTALPYYARNLKSVTEWVAPLSVEGLMPAIVELEQHSFDRAPGVRHGAAVPSPAPPRVRNLSPVPDKIQSYGLEMRDALTRAGMGLVWAALREGATIPKSSPREGPRIKASIVQVTNLGITIKDSPANTLIFVTRLDDAAPVAGAKVTIRTLDNKPFWSGQTDQRGLIKVPATPLRPLEDWWPLSFIVTAEKEGDVAYAASNWNEGILPWAFGLNFDLEEASPLLRGKVVTDRGVYKPGEEIHFKAVLRSDTAEGVQLFPPGTEVSVVVKDPRDREIDRRTIRLSEWSSAEWTFTLPIPGALGFHQIITTVEGHTRNLSNSFLVAAYRRPDFRVDVTLAGDPLVAGGALKGVIGGRYLYGAAMATRPVRWIYSKEPWNVVPPAIEERFPSERFTFLDEAWESRQSIERGTISQEEGALDAKGELPLNLPTLLSAGRPYQYTLEGEVTDVTRQTIAGRALIVVHPAPWYVGVRTPPYFAETRSGLDTEILAVTLDGKPAPGVAVEVTLTRVQWNSVRRAEGNGFYTWVTERKEIPAGNWDVVTRETPAALHIDIKEGGSYILKARASDGAGRSTLASVSFYALGEGYTAWAREDHNRIELVPERKKYKPGDTARILIKSPWESATALVTTEREGVRSERQFSLDTTQQTVEVPITESDIPNVYVSVLLVKGRTKPATDEDTSDPGKPSFRLGYAELSVEDASKRLGVEVTANREEYRPKDKAVISVRVKDHRGRGAKSEVTLWAVDYGVLSLTAYQTPDVLEAVYIPKAISVLTEDSRQRIVSRRVLTPKGASDGGGGGVGEGSVAGVRKDFRVLAFWLGSLVTDGEGKARANVALPESLTTYRIMAIAGDKVSRFGWGQREVRISKPLMLTPAFPRFLALGDKATFGSVVHSQSKAGGTAVVTMRSLDPSILEVVEAEKKTIRIDGASSQEIRYELLARRLGTAKIRTTVTMGNESDAFEESIPVTLIAPTESVVASGEADPRAAESFELPRGVLRDVGGLRIELASTALVGLNEGARYLVEYPYGCAEQRASSTLALMLASDLGGAFSIPGIEAGKIREKAQEAVRELETFQCPSGGFAFWPGQCESTSPYLTSYVVHVLQRAGPLGYAGSPAVLESAYGYLENEMSAPPPTNEAWWPAYTAWEAFVVKVLTKGGRNQDSNITRLYGYLDRMPVFALSYLFDALTAKGDKGPRVAELRRRIDNAILPEAATAHVEELADPYLLWFWNSNIRSTAIVLGSLVRNTEDRATAEKLVRWLMRVREKGRWGNTQENAHAMESLVDYYRKYEAEVPDFSAIVMLGGETLQKERFEGRTTDERVANKPMASLPSIPSLPLTFTKEGTGRLFYTARLTYARDELELGRLDRGFQVERSYSPMSGVGHGRAVPNPVREAAIQFAAGDLVRVTLRFRLPKERRFVAVTDPLPAGFEAVESWFATTASDLAMAQQEGERGARDWTDWFRRRGFDYVERRDDRVNLFATRLSEGAHEFSYVVRATTSGVFRAAPAHAEQMYEPEVFGRTETMRVTVE